MLLDIVQCTGRLSPPTTKTGLHHISLVLGLRNAANNPMRLGFSHILLHAPESLTSKKAGIWRGNERAWFDGSLLPDRSYTSKKQRSESMVRQKEHFTKSTLCTFGHLFPGGSVSLCAQCGMTQPRPAHKVPAALTRGGVLHSSPQLQAW